MTDQQTNTITPYYHKVAQRMTAEAPWVVLTLLLAVVMFIITAITVEGFLGSQLMMRGVLPRTLVLMLLVAPTTLLMASGNLDLSIGAAATLAGGLAAAAASETGMGLGIIVGIVVGAVIGLINALLVGAARLNGVVVTFISGAALEGGYLLLIGFQPRLVRMTPFIEALPGSPLVVLLALLVTAGAAALAILTPFGRRPTPTDPPESWRQRAVFEGVPYLFSGVMAGFAGVLLVSRFGMADPQIATYLTLQVILAALLGGTALAAGTGFVISSFFGTIGAALFDLLLTNAMRRGGTGAGLNIFLMGAWMLAALGVATLYHKVAQRYFDRQAEALEEGVEAESEEADGHAPDEAEPPGEDD